MSLRTQSIHLPLGLFMAPSYQQLLSLCCFLPFSACVHTSVVSFLPPSPILLLPLLPLPLPVLPLPRSLPSPSLATCFPICSSILPSHLAHNELYLLRRHLVACQVGHSLHYVLSAQLVVPVKVYQTDRHEYCQSTRSNHFIHPLS